MDIAEMLHFSSVPKKNVTISCSTRLMYYLADQGVHPSAFFRTALVKYLTDQGVDLYKPHRREIPPEFTKEDLEKPA